MSDEVQMPTWVLTVLRTIVAAAVVGAIGWVFSIDREVAVNSSKIQNLEDHVVWRTGG